MLTLGRGCCVAAAIVDDGGRAARHGLDGWVEGCRCVFQNLLVVCGLDSGTFVYGRGSLDGKVWNGLLGLEGDWDWRWKVEPIGELGLHWLSFCITSEHDGGSCGEM